jgi:serine/threonine protein kinase
MGNKHGQEDGNPAFAGSEESLENLYDRQRSKHNTIKKLREELNIDDSTVSPSQESNNNSNAEEIMSVPLKPPQQTSDSSTNAFASFMDEVNEGLVLEKKGSLTQPQQQTLKNEINADANAQTGNDAKAEAEAGCAVSPGSVPGSIPKRRKKKRKIYSRSGYDITPAIEITPRERRIKGIGIDHVYKSLAIIAEGGSCSVLKVRCTKSGREYALKQMMCDHKYNPAMYKQEIESLIALKTQPNVLNHYDHYMDSDSLYLITEFCSGGSLLDKILAMEQFTEHMASDFIKTVLDAIAYMHERDLIHRDLKPENIVFSVDPYGKDILKIIDFGDSITLAQDEHTTIYAGTRPYMAPQLFKTKAKQFFTHLSSHERKRYYGHELKKADVWSIGVICYVLVCGRLPFNGTRDQLPALICRGKFRWPRDIQLSDPCKQFITHLLVFDPARRVDAVQAGKHAWVAGQAANKNLGATFRKTLREFNATTKLTKLLVKTIWNVASASERKLIKYGLKKITAESDGILSTQQMFDYMMNFCHVNESDQFYVECTAKELEALMNIPENGVHVDQIDIGGLMSSFSIARDASIYHGQLANYAPSKMKEILANDDMKDNIASGGSGDAEAKKTVIESIIKTANTLTGKDGPQYDPKKVTSQMMDADGIFDPTLAFSPELVMNSTENKQNKKGGKKYKKAGK